MSTAGTSSRCASEWPRGSLGIVAAHEPGTTGPLDRSAVHGVTRHHDTINACYQHALKSSPDLRGRLIVDFTVDRTGRVAQPSVAHASALSGPIVRDCVFKAMRRLRFPAGDETSTAVRPTLDFTLHPR